ncbi:MAG: hypothetical protein JNG89_00090 [Planctomycetaceae bacterium]|nr:hypothetical protein [Planctomycetaceae bacterium]
MARKFAAVLAVFWASCALALDRPAVLLAAKVDYLKQAAAARTEYLTALDAEIARLESDGNPDRAAELRTHRGEWLLGDITAEDFRQFEKDALGPEHLQSIDAYIAAYAGCRSTLEAAFQTVIDDAKFIRLNEEAAEFELELNSFRDGSYIPTPVEVIRPRPYEVRRIATEPSLAMPAAAAKLPDELFVEFREQGFVISGTKRTDTATIDGKTRSHFGKGVVFILKQEGTKKLHGYFMIGALDDDGAYSFFTANKTKLTPILSLDDLELDTVYEWTIDAVRDEFRVEVRQNGEVIKSTRAFGGTGAVCGLFATLKHVDTESRLVVAVE